MPFPKSITKDELLLLPIEKYEGEIHLIDTPEALETATKAIAKHEWLGFDTESRPAFNKGEYFPVSLIQIATSESVYLIRNQKTGFSPGLSRIFSSEKILKIGVGLHDETKELKKLGPVRPEGFMDLNNLMKQIDIAQGGVRNLSGIFLGIRISKNQQTTNWEREELTEKQLRYAATDAWVCLEIYKKLKNWAVID